MTTALAPTARRTAVLYSVGDMSGFKPKMYRKLHTFADGSTASVLAMDGVPVFRSGTFRDSMGYQHTYDPFHIEQMVANYNLLKGRNILADVPVRDGHPGFLLSGQEGNGKVVGWHTDIKAEERVSPVDGQKYTYLLASYDIIDPAAQQAVESGLWRNRSAEVGTYITNDEAEFYPVYSGFAYVDIPAVEGLNGFSKTNPGLGTTFSLMIEAEEETPVQPGDETPEPEVEVDETPAPEAEVEETPEPEVEVEETPAPEAEVEETPAPEGEATDFSRQTGTFTFRVNGQLVTDFAAVQAHIDALEGFARETTEANRRDFVAGLVRDKKITGAQQTALESFALGLDAEQYAAWCGTYDLAPELGLLQLHAAGSSNTEGGTQEQQRTEADLTIAREIVFSHKLAGMPLEKIEATPSFKKLRENDPTFTL